MYEIWLMLNIAWEILLPIMPVVVVLLLVWVGLMARATFGGAANWAGGLGRALLIGVVVAVVAFFVIPAHSSPTCPRWVTGLTGSRLWVCRWPLGRWWPQCCGRSWQRVARCVEPGHVCS